MLHDFPSDCDIGKEAAILEQGGGSLGILVLPYRKPIDRGKIRVGYRLDNSTFECHRRRCESGPDLLDYRGNCEVFPSVLSPGY